MAGAPPDLPDAAPIAGLRFCVPTTLVLDGLDDFVARAFQSALSRLSRAGAKVSEIAFPELGRIPELSPHGGVLAAEALAVHRKLIAEKGDLYDARVRTRILRATALTAADYVELFEARLALIATAARRTAPYDAALFPTTPMIAPAIAALDADERLYGQTNILMLRNTSVGNYLDRCALSIPCHAPGEAPVGLMVMGETMGDARLLSVGLAIEAALNRE
jgi:aspartyl-tRNA(Asn)/glutamyl-tRNA(Gln) amidotransferase subunit A